MINPPSLKASRAVLCLALGEIIVWAGLYYLFPALLLRWELAQGWSKTSLTAAFAGAVVVSALVSPLAGRWIDRGQGPQVMATSALLGAVLLALLPLADSIWLFAGLWLLIGVAMGGCLYEPCFALIMRTRGAEAQRGITIVTLFAGFAGTVSFPLNHALAELFGWQAATLTFAGIMAFCGVPLIWIGARYLEMQWQTDSGEKTAQVLSQSQMSGSATDILYRPAFWLLAVGFSLLAINHGVVLNHLLPILQDRGVRLDAAVLAASMIGPMQVAGRLAVMCVERYVSSTAITTACFIAVSVATVCLFMASFSPLLIAAFVVLQGSGFGVTSIMKAVVIRDILGDKNFGTINGLMALPYLIAFALAPFFGSLLWEIGGYQFVLIVVASFAVLGLFSYRMAVRLSI